MEAKEGIGMWLLAACGSACFAGMTAILAKCGVREIESNLATAIRTIVVLVFSWLMVLISGNWRGLAELDLTALLFLVLSGLATGASWLCYFRALQRGAVSQVAPVDKSSTVLTILLAMALFHETAHLWLKLVCVALISAGTWLMIERAPAAPSAQPGRGSLPYALLAAVFAALTAILGKLGVSHIASDLATAIRTVVVLVMAWLVVFVTRKPGAPLRAPRRDLRFLLLSGLTTGASWLCYYSALQNGPASVVVPVDKLSIVVTILFSRFVLHERLTQRSLFGLLLIVAGTLAMAILA